MRTQCWRLCSVEDTIFQQMLKADTLSTEMEPTLGMYGVPSSIR